MSADLQIIIEEIVNNVRAVDRESVLAPETMRHLVEACVQAVNEGRRHEQRVKEERSVDGPWGLSGEREV